MPHYIHLEILRIIFSHGAKVFYSIFALLACNSNLLAITQVMGQASASTQAVANNTINDAFANNTWAGSANAKVGTGIGFNGETAEGAEASVEVNLVTGKMRLYAWHGGAVHSNIATNTYLLSYGAAYGEFLETVSFNSLVSATVTVIFNYHAYINHPEFVSSPDSSSTVDVGLLILNQDDEPFALRSDFVALRAEERDWSGQLTVQIPVGPTEFDTNTITINPEMSIRTGYSSNSVLIDAKSTGFIEVLLPDGVTMNSESGVFLTGDDTAQVPDSSNFLVLPLILATFVFLKRKQVNLSQ